MTEKQRKAIRDTHYLQILSRCVDPIWRQKWQAAAAQVNANDVDGAVGDYFGVSVNALGDVNSDGFRDFIVGSTGNDDVTIDAGSASVFIGGSAGTIPTLSRWGILWLVIFLLVTGVLIVRRKIRQTSQG